MNRRTAGPILMAVTLALLAQDASAQALHVGLIGGPSTAEYRQKHELYAMHPLNDRSGAMGGVTARLDLSRIVALQLELLHAEKGFDENADHTMRSDFLELPVLLRVSIPIGVEWATPVLMGGMAPSREWRCGGREVGQSIGWVPPSSRPIDCENWRTELADLGAVASVGFAIRRGDFGFEAHYRYTHGLQNQYLGFDMYELRYRTSAILIGVTHRVW
jgi:hypothetical protein